MKNLMTFEQFLNEAKEYSQKELETKVQEFLKKYPSGKIPDSDVHKISEELNINTHELESIFYKFAANYVNEDLNETKFFAFWQGKKHEIDGKDLWDAKQKAITMLKIPKSKVGLLAVVSAKSQEQGDFMFEDQVPGGKGDETDENSVDYEELQVGQAVEKEHTDDPQLAKEIALDHLTEDPKYYSKLIKSGIVDEKEALDLAKKFGW